MNDLNKAKSLLKLTDLYFTKITYNKIGESKSKANPKMGLSQSIEERNEGEYKVILSLKVEKKDAFGIEIEMVGLFVINEDLEAKPILVRNNTVAIMFPYIRSELTLLTAQPNMAPIVLPPININQLLKNEVQNENPSDSD